MSTSSTSPATVDEEVFTDLERLQGAWITVSGRRQGELLIAGRLYTVKLDGAIYMGSFSLCGGERPKAMNMWIDEAPIHHKGKIALCIYALEDDLLRWCTGEPGAEQRPTTFPSVNDPHYLYLIFERQRLPVRPITLSEPHFLGRNEQS
jgi:uncharacterized protein (TIGR03067 family)